MKKQKGITLVSLVVTIIILIILAGVSINLTLGKNGIITIAKQAKENTELAKIEEETALNELYMQIEAEGGTSGENSYDFIAKLVEFKEKIATAITNKGIETSKDATADVMAENIGKIDATEKLLEFKTAIANYIEEAGGIKPETTADTSTFRESIKGILKEATKDATATAEDIAKGKTAYIKGELITGTSTYSKLKVGIITKSNSSLFEIPANFEPDIIILYGTATSNYQFSVIYANSEINIVGWYAGDGATYKIQNLLFQNDTVSFEINYPYGTNSTMYGGTFNYILAKK